MGSVVDLCPASSVEFDSQALTMVARLSASAVAYHRFLQAYPKKDSYGYRRSAALLERLYSIMAAIERSLTEIEDLSEIILSEMEDGEEALFMSSSHDTSIDVDSIITKRVHAILIQSIRFRDHAKNHSNDDTAVRMTGSARGL